MSGQFKLLKQKRFAPLFITQFLGAFNDNLYKNALVVLLTFQSAQWTSLAPEIMVNIAAGIFILPFFLFSATAGQLADKYDKAALARLTKLLEILIMLVAAAGFWFSSLSTLMSALFLLGLQSTLFGPVKYSILPQHLKRNELLGGNALVEAGTFVAILIGTLTGGLLASTGNAPIWIVAGGLLVAIAGYLSSRKIPPAPAPAPELRISLNPITETLRNIGFARQNRTVFLSILGISWFWLYGALFLTQLPGLTKNVLGGDEILVTTLLAIFTLGIGLGSLLCERLSGNQVEIGLVPFGSIGLTLFGLDLFFAAPVGFVGETVHSLGFLLGHGAVWRVFFDLFMLGLFGGFFIVPLYALVQMRSAEQSRARIIAANNILNALFMVLGAIAAVILLTAGVSIPTLFAIAALINAAVAIYIYSLVPEFFIRFIAWLLIKTIYRLRISGKQHIPESGPAILVANHVSFADAVILMGSSPRPIRFIMDYRIFKTPILGFIFRHSGAIPIAPAKENAQLMEQAFQHASAALDNGELVGIFPEGAITRDGEMQPFRPGISRILQANPVPVVPMALSGLWGSFFSRIDGSAMKSPFRRGAFSRIDLHIGPAIAAVNATPATLHTKVLALRGERQ
ncbi:MAG: MFS transporter [Thiopseudomonas sp.]|nr:MFS transporter [Thiopseudomonas sp.]MCK9466374.1 MFS transporter [Thiopseudomonas sp.]